MGHPPHALPGLVLSEPQAPERVVVGSLWARVARAWATERPEPLAPVRQERGVPAPSGPMERMTAGPKAWRAPARELVGQSQHSVP